MTYQVSLDCKSVAGSSSRGFLRDLMSASVCSIERRSLLFALGTVCDVCVCVCVCCVVCFVCMCLCACALRVCVCVVCVYVCLCL